MSASGPFREAGIQILYPSCARSSVPRHSTHFILPTIASDFPYNYFHSTSEWSSSDNKVKLQSRAYTTVGNPHTHARTNSPRLLSMEHRSLFGLEHLRFLCLAALLILMVAVSERRVAAHPASPLATIVEMPSLATSAEKTAALRMCKYC